MAKDKLTDCGERKQPVDVSREELYRQVWETPMSRLAVQYGITGNGLAKICERMLVPYPPRGHWAKKAAGKTVALISLPQAGEDTPYHLIPAALSPDLCPVPGGD